MAPAVPEKPETHSDLEIWHVGKMLPTIVGNQLPKNKQVLGRLFLRLMKETRTLSDSASRTIDGVFAFWLNANMPTTQKPNAITKLKSLYEAYVSLSNTTSHGRDRRKKIKKKRSEVT